jgi:hypothetical protein
MNRNAEGLEARILADLRPVRPLARPWKRGLAVCGLGAAVAAASMLHFGIRSDAPLLGPVVLWGLSAVQAVFGLLLMAVALRESVPGRGLSPRWASTLLLLGVAFLPAVTLVTWHVHASLAAAGKAALYWRVCFETPAVIGLPELALTLLLAFRAYPTRPALVGALAGLGAGLLTDGSWRTYCEVTDPVHVLSAHSAAVLLLALAGSLVAAAVHRVRE